MREQGLWELSSPQPLTTSPLVMNLPVISLPVIVESCWGISPHPPETSFICCCCCRSRTISVTRELYDHVCVLSMIYVCCVLRVPLASSPEGTRSKAHHETKALDHLASVYFVIHFHNERMTRIHLFIRSCISEDLETSWYQGSVMSSFTGATVHPH